MSTQKISLYEDSHFFAAALSQSLISVWVEDLGEVDRGYITRYTNEYVRIKNEVTGEHTYHSRDLAAFQRV